MNPYGGDPFDQKTFTLPLSGAVRLWGPEVEVVRTRAFQRLAGIKQLGTAYVAFRGAVHTRFEHSLGALHEAERLVNAVNRNPLSPEMIGPYEQTLIRMGALLHDVTHIPFSHTLEDEFHLLQRHDKNDGRRERLLFDSEIGEFLRDSLGQDWWADFVALLDACRDGDPTGLDWPYVADIIGNTVCADMLDYVPRDLSACGMPATVGDRFLGYFTISSGQLPDPTDRRRMVLNLDKRGMPRPDVESEVLKLLTYRYELVERVYFHHAKNAASVMLARALMSAGLLSDESFDWLSDEMLLLVLREPSIARACGIRMERRARESRELASELADRIWNRDLYKIAYLGVHDDLVDRVDELTTRFKAPDAREGLENELAAKAGLDPGEVLVHIPPSSMLLKLAEVRVLTHRGNVITLDRWDAMHSGRARALNEAHRRLWRVTAYVHPGASEAKRRLVRAAAEDAFGAPSRYIKAPSGTAHLREIFEQHAGQRGWTVDDWEAVREMAAFGDMRDPFAIRDLMQTYISARRTDDA